MKQAGSLSVDDDRKQLIFFAFFIEMRMGQGLPKPLSWDAPLFMGKVLMGDRKQESFSHFRPEL
jgi:hypothetical protein